MTEPAVAVDDTGPIPTVRLVPEDEQTAAEWLDEQAAKAGRLWAAKWPGGRDW